MPPAPLPPDEAGRLAALRSYAVLDTACEASFDEIARLAARLTRRPFALVSLVDADRQWLKNECSPGIQNLPRSVAFCDHTIRSDAVLVVADATRDPRFANVPVIMCTSKNQETDKVWGMRQGARDYIVKPVDADELVAKIHAFD